MSEEQKVSTIRNVAIIAHVDHGKTTLIDNLLQQSGTFYENQQVAERVMDSNDLEKERGITILAKCTSIVWKGERINIIDTPGHSDFGGEVERVLSMADAVILLVDCSEGPMPQTKFVLSKALKAGLKPIVVINKVDRPDERIKEVEDEIIDLFISLEANDDQLDFKVLYASGRSGWCVNSLKDEKRDNLHPLLDTVAQTVEPKEFDKEAPFSMLVVLLDYDKYLGRILIGRVYSGKAEVNMNVKVINLKGEPIEQGRLTKLQSFIGLSRQTVDSVVAGDIVVIAGMKEASVSNTICSPDIQEPIPSTPIDPPTIAVTIGANSSPLAGTEGTKVTGSMIGERLMKEAETNVAITVKRSDEGDAYEVGGRGELQLGVLIETMRREGFELSVSRPKVLVKKDEETGQKLEPIEEVTIDIDEEYSSTIIDMMNMRKGEMQDMVNTRDKTRLIFLVPSRGLIGCHSKFLSSTRGTGVMNRIFHSYAPHKGELKGRVNGVLVAIEAGNAIPYALFGLQDRGILFVNPQDKVYEGMIVGEHNRSNDLSVNTQKGKKLTNMRASGTDENVILSPPVIMTLEAMISYVEEGELVEVTPKSIRLRKKYLTENERKRASRGSK